VYENFQEQRRRQAETWVVLSLVLEKGMSEGKRLAVAEGGHSAWREGIHSSVTSRPSQG
jgi:hypothetical protein